MSCWLMCSLWKQTLAWALFWVNLSYCFCTLRKHNKMRNKTEFTFLKKILNLHLLHVFMRIISFQLCFWNFALAFIYLLRLCFICKAEGQNFHLLVNFSMMVIDRTRLDQKQGPSTPSGSPTRWQETQDFGYHLLHLTSISRKLDQKHRVAGIHTPAYGSPFTHSV